MGAGRARDAAGSHGGLDGAGKAHDTAGDLSLPEGTHLPCARRGVLQLTKPRRADGGGTAVSGALTQARAPRVVPPDYCRKEGACQGQNLAGGPPGCLLGFWGGLQGPLWGWKEAGLWDRVGQTPEGLDSHAGRSASVPRLWGAADRREETAGLSSPVPGLRTVLNPPLFL